MAAVDRILPGRRAPQGLRFPKLLSDRDPPPLFSLACAHPDQMWLVLSGGPVGGGGDRISESGGRGGAQQILTGGAGRLPEVRGGFPPAACTPAPGQGVPQGGPVGLLLKALRVRVLAALGLKNSQNQG